MAENMEPVYIGIDLGGTDIKGGVVSAAGRILTDKKITTRADEGVRFVLKRMAGLVRDLMETVGDDSAVGGVGVGAPGQIDFESGVVRNAPNLPGWRNVKALDILEKLLSISVAWDNDANVAALGEQAYGAGRGADDMMMITLGTGIGGGLILDGKLYRGCRGFGGEFGHTIVNPAGPPCHCGRNGCVESYAGSYSIVRTMYEKLQGEKPSLLSDVEGSLTPEHITEAARQGDEVALEVYRETGYWLGLGLANAVSLLNLERIVVGGGVAKAGDLILDPMRESMERFAMKNAFESVVVVPAVLGNRAGLVGAARLASLKGNF